MRLVGSRWRGRGPAVILLHGLASQRHHWSLVAQHLGGTDLLALDQRGHGDADRPDDGYDFATLTRDLSTVLDAAAIDRAVVVGHSWGAAVALSFAAAHPERVLAVVALDGGFLSVSDRDVSREEMRRLLEPPRLELTEASLIDMFRHGPLAPWWSAEVRESVLPAFALDDDGKVRARLPFERHMQIVDALLDYDAAAALGAIRCPAWLVSCEPVGDATDGYSHTWGTRKAAALDRAASLVSRPRLLRWAGALHDVPLQWPALVAGLVRSASDEVTS